jgi:hypothetical protein
MSEEYKTNNLKFRHSMKRNFGSYEDTDPFACPMQEYDYQLKKTKIPDFNQSNITIGPIFFDNPFGCTNQDPQTINRICQSTQESTFSIE